MIGETFGRLTVIAILDNALSKRGNPIRQPVLCRCSCGFEGAFDFRNVCLGKSKSCGCLSAEMAKARFSKTKKNTDSPVYESWAGMKGRCLNPKDFYYHRYGGRGIKVCQRWMAFSLFEEDMLPSWFSGATLERVENNGDYEPGNCKWATMKEQANNRCTSKFVTFNGKTMTVANWAVELGINYGLLSGRLNKRNWTVERAMTEPVRHFFRKTPRIV